MSDMSLYYVQKLLYQFNRDVSIRDCFDKDPCSLIQAFDLTHEEVEAIRAPDLGLLYVMGVNGQILVSFAALRGYAWPDYIDALQAGLRRYGPVRSGIYAETGYQGVKKHTSSILARKRAGKKEVG